MARAPRRFSTPVLGLPPGEGVLASQHLLTLIDRGVIHAGDFTIPPENVQPASLDLRLGEVAYRIQCSFLPDDQTVERKVKDYIIDEIPLGRDGAVLETKRPYLIPLKECLSLPAGMRGKTNPKSSTGRLDVFTRVITDHSYRFDQIRDGYEGHLYLEVVPLSFPIRVRENLTLNQLRLSVGRAELTDQEVCAAHEVEAILLRHGKPLRTEDLALANGLFLGLDLNARTPGGVGYRARDNAPLLDMTQVGPIAPDAYWEEVHAEPGDRVILTPERFYLLMSKEAVCIPPSLASEMTAYDPTSGELRTHYAGFFDPGFGYDPIGRLHGSRAALEVRAHDVPFMIEDGQRVCKLTFERMLEPPLAPYGLSLRSSYQRQEVALGKHFIRSSPGGTGVTEANPDQMVFVLDDLGSTLP
jgi:dCTP deaminase